ncbi:hypothetical protein T07_11535 [Trichinella nelsoni]|uniref:Uncharacterized protein n=1 Tax=Trichinella nelsoni TaxID=6336 RepID=A0A0V0SCW4_9BILA|nr:hypothetical protein T07_11535 [Trichinella nelsoni]
MLLQTDLLKMKLHKTSFKICSERTPMTNGVQHCVGKSQNAKSKIQYTNKDYCTTKCN